MRRSPCIVVVEDDRETLEALRFLVGVGLPEFHLIGVRSATEALEILDGAPVAAVLADLHLQGMSGLELLQRWRAASPETRLILATGSHDEATAAAAAGIPVDHLLPKPFSPGAFLGLLRSVAEGAA